jgi:hypothetical protein
MHDIVSDTHAVNAVDDSYAAELERLDREAALDNPHWQAVKECIAKGNQARRKAEQHSLAAEQHYLAAGQHLKVLKAAHDERGGTWFQWEALLKERVGIGKSRASELMQIADGTKTVEGVRAETAERTRQARISPLRSGENANDPEASASATAGKREAAVAPQPAEPARSAIPGGKTKRRTSEEIRVEHFKEAIGNTVISLEILNEAVPVPQQLSAKDADWAIKQIGCGERALRAFADRIAAIVSRPPMPENHPIGGPEKDDEEPAAERSCLCPMCQCGASPHSVAPDEEIALLREFATFVITRASSVSVDPKDHAEWKALRERVKAILGVVS